MTLKKSPEISNSIIIIIMGNIRYELLGGSIARKWINEIAALRIMVFREYPYLYDGDIHYEKKYLETYFKSPNSLVILCYDENKLIGVSTCIPMEDEEPSFKKPFIERGFNTDQILYFGESILLPQYRGVGIGKNLILFREEHARKLGKQHCVFCAVVRDPFDARRGSGYRDPERLWRSNGYRKISNLTTTYNWKEVGEAKESPKLMQFWIKDFA